MSPAQPPKSAEAEKAPPQKPAGEQRPQRSGSLLDLDLDALSRTEVRPSPPAAASPATIAAPSTIDAAPRPASPSTTSITAAGPAGQTITPSQTDAAQQVSTGQLLERAAGVSVRRTSALNLDPRVRGYHTSQIAAGANGITQLKTRIDIDSLFSQIDPGNVQNITVVDGPYTSLHGPAFSFLLAQLAPAAVFPNGYETHASANFSHGTNGRQIYHRERVWGGDERTGFNVSYGQRLGTDYDTGDRRDPRVPASYHQEDVFVALRRDLSVGRIELNYLRTNLRDTELPGIAYDIRWQSPDQVNVRFVVQDDPDSPERFVAQYWATRTPYRGDSLGSAKRATFFDVLLGQAFPDLLGGSLLNQGLSQSTGARVLATYGDKDSLQFTVGADWRRYEQFYRETDYAADGTPVFSGNVFGIPRSSLEDAGAFVQATAPVGPNVTLTAGGRVDRTSAHVDTRDVVSLPTLGDPNGFFHPGFGTPSETLGMGFFAAELQMLSWLRTNLGVAFAMRNPNLAELYSDEPYAPVARFGNSFVDGNSDLVPEKNVQFDVGAAAKWSWLTLQSRAFHATVRDYILAVPANVANNIVPVGVAAPVGFGRDLTAFGIDPTDPTINGPADTHSVGYRYSNLSQATFYGGELSGELIVHDGVTLGGSIAYVKGTNHAPVRYDFPTNTLIPLKGAEGLPGIYPLNSTLRLRLFEPERERWSLELVARLVAGQHFVADSLGEVFTPGFTVFDLQGAYQVTPRVRLYSSLQNLFDRNYTEHGSLVLVTPRGTLGFVKERGLNWIVGVEVRY